LVQTSPIPTLSPRRAELVAAAARLFSERGYHGTSMKHLADSLGVLKGSLYAHIGKKEELLFDVVAEGAERFLARGNEAVAMGGTASARLEAFLVGHIETAIEHLDAATVFLNEWRYLSDDLRADVQIKRDAYEGLLREIVTEGIASGEFRADADVAMTARLVLSAGNWVYAWYRPDGSLSSTEIGHRYTELIVRGLQSQPTNAPATAGSQTEVAS
jgi:TetR/AcrR family transcriptional regulator, cholesterol catabolism regulator